MRVLIDGRLYDSKETPVLLVFDDNEKEIFDMNRFVSAPEESTVEERQKLIDTVID
ncbi:hypothetical protein [Halobacillus litoralis]|uniref:hypothetical protein n=1 Tax=Halobacillus litoralis TaxID=45668 RepID=UPI001CD71834|nr:hypothetical protein [Halobacillus litoralis]MCA1021533.1 hypothetical protein [Halobacillus litoralis]